MAGPSGCFESTSVAETRLATRGTRPDCACTSVLAMKVASAMAPANVQLQGGVLRMVILFGLGIGVPRSVSHETTKHLASATHRGSLITSADRSYSHCSCDGGREEPNLRPAHASLSTLPTPASMMDLLHAISIRQSLPAGLNRFARSCRDTRILPNSTTTVTTPVITPSSFLIELPTNASCSRLASGNHSPATAV